MGRELGLGGRGNSPGNPLRDLEQIWLAGFPHARECYRLYHCVMGAARGRGMGVGGRVNIDLDNGWMDFDKICQRVPSRPREDSSLWSYVMVVACGRKMVVGVRGYVRFERLEE